MQVGVTIQDRFEILARGKAGGMGRIYRARDLTTGAEVALKMLHPSRTSAAERFHAEAAALADIHHPGVVRHVDHGRTANGRLYLVMEWLEGEDLGQRLRDLDRELASGSGESAVGADGSGASSGDGAVPEASDSTLVDSVPLFDPTLAEHSPPRRANSTHHTVTVQVDARAVATRRFRPLSITETVVLARRLSSAVAELHRRGIVHRDIKPGNIFLPERVVAQAKLLDLGMIRRTVSGRQYTEVGALVGTPHYMAPEQARAKGNVTPATDVWAIGCVLYACLTGARPFDGEDVAGILASIILTEPAPVQTLSPQVPGPLADLVMEALAKAPEHRPANAGALVAALGALRDDGTQRPGTRTQSRLRLALTARERRVACVLLAARSNPPERAYGSEPVFRDVDDAQLVTTARAAGGSPERLANGTLMVTVPGSRPPVDQAARMGLVALGLRAALPSLRIVITTGCSEEDDLLGPAVAEAGQALVRLTPGSVWIDPATGSLLKSRFSIYRDTNGFFLQGTRIQESSRSLLGRASPYVGREREMARLTATLQVAMSEGPQTVLLIGPPGMGKSRLRREFERALAAAGVELTVLRARGDAVGAGSAFMLLSQAIIGELGLQDADSAEHKRARLRARVAQALVGAGPDQSPDQIDEVTVFLGELAGLPFPDGARSDLDAARSDPILMAQRTAYAWETWLRYECQRRPVLIILDDLHWGDLPSIQHLDRAMTALADGGGARLMVMALARPEVRMVFPGLWSEREVEEIALTPLSLEAAELLVRAGLGEDAPDPLVSSLIARSGGNAFYLEELIRSVAQGAALTLPDTVLGTVQARLDSLAPEAKRILRAGSIFGEVFWLGGVKTLLGSVGVFQVREWLDDLVAREIITERPRSRLANEVEYQFRHTLVRDAAYALLTRADRELGHGLAGSWLEQAGEHDSRILAEHYLRSRMPERAVPKLCRAVEHALEGNDFGAVQILAERGVEAGADGEQRGQLRAHQALASFWQSRYADSRQLGLDAITALEEGSPLWFGALGCAIVATARLGDAAAAADLLDTAMDASCTETGHSAQIACLCRGAVQLVLSGRNALVDQILARIEALATSANYAADGPDIATEAQIADLRAIRAGCSGDIVTARRYMEQAAAAFERAGDLRNATMTRISLAWSRFELGDVEGARRRCEEILVLCQQQKAHQATVFARVHLARTYTRDPARRQEARRLLNDCVAEFATAGNRRVEGYARSQLADLERRAGNLEQAQLEIERTFDALDETPGFQSWALAVHARVLLAQGQTGLALAQAQRAMDIHKRLGGILHDTLLPPLMLAQALHAAGELLDARAVIVEAAMYIERTAARLTDADARARYLAMEEASVTLALAARWAGWTAAAEA